MTPEEIEKLPYRPNVGAMLVNKHNQVFVGQRIDRPKDAPPAWQMPQGGVDKDEDPRIAVLRELQEETGVRPDLVQIIGETQEWLPYELPHDLIPKLWKGRYRGQKQKWFLIRFEGTDEDINIWGEEPEFDAWKWTGIDDLVANIVPFKRDLYAAVVAELRTFL